MATTAQLAQYCSDHFPQTYWSLSHMNWFSAAFWAAVVVGAYIVGRVGIPAAWSDLKSLFTTIKGWFSGTKAPATTSTATQTVTATTVTTPVTSPA